MSGAFIPIDPIESSPYAVAEALEGKQRISAIDVHTAVVAGPAGEITALSFKGKSFDNSAFEVLAEQLQQMMGLEAIDFSNCSGLSDAGFKEVLRALCGCESLLRINLSGCSLKPADLTFIANEVASWAKSVTEWDISNNSAIGSAAVLEFVGSLNGSSVQRLDISNTGINDSKSGATILSELLGMSHLVAVGVGRNNGITVANFGGGALAEIEDFLRENADMSGMDGGDHVGLVDHLTREEKEKKKAAAPSPTPTPAPEPAPKAPKAAASGVVRRGASPAKKRADSPSAQQPASARPTVPSTTGAVRRGNSPARKPAAPTPEPRAATPTRRATSAAAAGSRAGTPVRAGSAARGSSPARMGAVTQREVTDGYEHWLENKAKYNDYISCGIKKKKPSAEGEKPKAAFYTYKYAFGKSVDKAKESGNRTVRNTAIIRDPTPHELRTLAPWVTDREYVSSPGRTLYVDDPTCPGGKIRFVDGGDLRIIENDPREIGYVARKRESGQLSTTRTGGFASTSTREVRFGTEPANQVIRWAQAPGPGHYYVKSQFEINAEKAQVNAANRPAFGSRGDRIAFNKIKKDPNEDSKPVTFYEIP